MMLFNAIGAAEEIDAFHKILRPTVERPKLNILISFPYIRGQVSLLIRFKAEGKIGKLFLDAGTFTINIKSSTVNPLPQVRFAEYVQYVKLYGKHYDHIAAYDQDFFDSDLNMHNLIRMEKIVPAELRDRIIPVVHAQNEEAIKEFRDLISLGYDYIAIGSTPAMKKPIWKKIETIIQEMKVSGRDIKTHTFGSMSFKSLKERRPYSADSSSFAKIAGQETMLYWNHETNQLDEVKLLDLSDPEQAKKDKRVEWTYKHDEYLMRLFGTISKSELIAHTPQRHLVNFYAIYEMEKHFTDTEQQA